MNWYDSINRKPYPRCENYLVAKDGTVWRSKSKGGKPLATPVLITPRVRSGYPSVGVWSKSVQKAESVHVMVLETFVGPRPLGFQAEHLDGNRLNPRLENLRWATKSENNSRKRDHGTMPVGVASGTAKLNNSAVIEMRRMASEGVSFTKIGAAFGVHRTTAQRAVVGKRWGHIALIRAKQAAKNP